jgi:hypothetical protein
VGEFVVLGEKAVKLVLRAESAEELFVERHASIRISIEVAQENNHVALWQFAEVEADIIV